MIPAEILTAVAAEMRQAEAEGWPVLGAESFTDDELVGYIARAIRQLKARGWGK